MRKPIVPQPIPATGKHIASDYRTADQATEAVALEPLPFDLTPRLVHLNVDALVDAYERRPATRSRARAWEWLSEQRTVTFTGEALIVPSATWESVRYLATPDFCTCPARKHCHHKEAAAIVAAVLAEEAAIEQAAERESYVDTYVLDQARIGQTVSPRDRQIVRSVSTRAAVASGLAECF